MEKNNDKKKKLKKKHHIVVDFSLFNPQNEINVQGWLMGRGGGGGDLYWPVVTYCNKAILYSFRSTVKGNIFHGIPLFHNIPTKVPCPYLFVTLGTYLTNVGLTRSWHFLKKKKKKSRFIMPSQVCSLHRIGYCQQIMCLWYGVGQ